MSVTNGKRKAKEIHENGNSDDQKNQIQIAKVKKTSRLSVSRINAKGK